MRVPKIAVACGLLITAANAGAQQLDPIINFCIRFDHQSVVKNNTLYIDGGRETFINVEANSSSAKQVGSITEGYNNYLVAIDLSQSWNWATNISEKALAKTANPRTGTKPPVLSRGALLDGLANDSNIYLWGGTTSYWNTSFRGYEPPTPQQYSLWSFDTASQEWDQYDLTLGSANRPSSGSSTRAMGLGLGFYFNGELDSGSEIETQSYGDGVKQLIGGMIVVDLVNHTARNLSTDAVSGDMPRSRGSMIYIDDIGSHGIIVQIGGNHQNVTNTTGITSPRIENLVRQRLTVQELKILADRCGQLPMDEIDIFDVASYYNDSTPDGTWYKQKTSGDTPNPRIDFCLVLASAPDGSSNNVYLYGGRGADSFFDEIWVLSIPSFTWTKVYQGQSPRFGHTCHRVSDRTMITVGGAANDDWHSAPCDWETKGVGVFDMSDLVWGSVYNASAPAYTVPSPVTVRIGGSPSGGAAMYEPSPSGFDSPGLADLFKVQYHGPPAPSAPTPSPRPLESRPNHRTAIIIGSLVGGIAGLTLVLELGWCYRRQIQRHITGGEYPRPEMDNHERVMLEMDAQKRNIQEMDDQQNFVQEMLGTESKTHWELPADNKPVEMWSPTDRSDRRSRSGGGQSCQGAPPADEKKGPESPTSGGLILEGSPKSKGSQRYDDKMLPPLPIC